MKRRIVSLLLAVIMLFGLLPVTALAHDHWSSNDAVFIGAGGFESQTYTIFGGETGVTAGYSVWDGNYLTHRIELHDSDGSYIDYAKCTDTIGGAWIFFRGNYWYDAYDWKNMGAPSEKSGHDDVLTLGTLQIASKEKDRVLYVRRYPLTIFDSNSNAYATVSQRSQFSRNSTQDRTVILYLDGTEVARKTVLFPNRNDPAPGDLHVTAKSGYVHASTKVDGSTYHVYLTTGPRKVEIRYKLIGDHKTKGAVDTNGLKNNTIANAVFQDKSWNQSNNFTQVFEQLPTTTVEINTARSTNQLLLYEAADVKLVSGDAGIENSGTDKYKITVGYENSVIEVAYKAKFPHVDPLYIDWYKRGAGGIFDLLKENANQPYGFDLTNLHKQETFYVIQNGGLTQAAKDAGLGQEYVDSEGQHYRFWKAAVGFDWDWIDSLYYKSSAQTWFYTYKINLYYRDIFAHEWKVWKTITVGPIEVPYDEGRVNFVYQKWNPDTHDFEPEEKGDYTLTLQYDANAGAERIGVPAPDTRTDVAMDNGKYTFYVSVYQPTRDGYTFLGWDENPNAGTPNYPASANTGKERQEVFFYGSDGKTQTKTLYAIWEKTGGDSATYTATYYWNYDEKTDSYHTQENLKTGDKLTQPDDPTREGYTFGGWYTTDTCTDGTKWDFATNTVQKQDIYLYAKWTEAASADYTIYYYVDDVKDESKTETGSGSVGDEITAPDKKPTSGNYVLDTSRTPADLKLTLVEDSSKNVLNVYYEKDEHGNRNDGTDGPDGVPDKYQVKVTFKVDGGTWSNETSDPIVKWLTLKDGSGNWSVDGSASYTTPTGMICTTSFPGYFATGSWSTPAPNTDGIYRKADDGKEFTYSWTQGDKDDSQWATVTFVAGEHGSLTGTTTVTVLKGTAWNTITVPGTAPEAGYKFKEWTPVFPETITESATYAASFETDDDQWATVTFVAGEHGSLTGTTTVTVLKGTAWNTITVPGTAPEAGYKFKEWTPDFPETITESATYTASFETDDDQWATVTFVAGEHGSLTGTTTVTVLKGIAWNTITVPGTAPEAGYKFKEWTPVFPETITESATYTASFVINEGEWVTIQFAAGPNGSLIGDTSVTVLKNTLWSEITVPETKGDTGYTFLEWSPALPDSTDAIMESATYTAYFTKKDGDWVSVDYVIVGGHGDFVSGAQTHFEILKDTLWGAAGISAPAVEAEYGYYFDGWTGELAADEAISENITVVGRFEQEFDIIPAIIEILKPRDMLTKEHIAYLNGYSDGTVRPNGNITRAEVATIFFRLLTDEVRDANLTYGNTFTDVPNGAWYNAAVSTLSSMQIINGYTDGSFRPNQNITRAELASIIARFAELKNTSGVYFTDIDGHWAADNICLAAANGWITGYADGSFKPNRPVTRAETVTMINRVLERSPLSTDDLLDGMVTYSDNLDTTAWYYLAIQEASNTHDYTRMTVGEFWRSLLPNRDWSRYQR